MAWIQKTKTVFTLPKIRSIKKVNSLTNKVKSPQVRGVTNNPSIEEVRKYIRTILMEKKEKGLSDCELVSGDIHKELNMQSALPTVCSAMRTLGGGYVYKTIEEPPRGNGTRLKLKYILKMN